MYKKYGSNKIPYASRLFEANKTKQFDGWFVLNWILSAFVPSNANFKQFTTNVVVNTCALIGLRTEFTVYRHKAMHGVVFN